MTDFPPASGSRAAALELKARIALSLMLAALLPVFAMDMAVLKLDFSHAKPGVIEAVVVGSGLGAGLLGLALGWLLSGVVVRYAHERVLEATAQLVGVKHELEVERDRLAYAMEGSRLAMWDLDMLTGDVHLSANWAALMGAEVRDTTIPIAELIDRIPAEEQEDCWEAVRAVMRGKSDFYDVEHRVRRNDGSLMWIRSRGAVSARGDGKVLRMTGTNFDITARKEAELALQESEAKLRLIADNLPVMVIYADRDLKFLFANRPYLEFFGVTLGDVIGRSLGEVAGAAAEALLREKLPALARGETVGFERERPNRAGETRSYEIRVVPKRGHGGELIGVLAVIQDVTDDREARRSLAAGSRALQVVTDGVPAMISRVALDGRIVFANRRFREFRGMAGLDPALHAADVAPDTWETIARNLERLKAGREIVYDRAIPLPDSERHLEVHLVPQRDAEGRLESVFVLENDVTQRALAARVFEQMALTDPLTALPNKRLLLDRLERAMSQSGRRPGDVAILFVDLDGFKQVNDSRGHAAGDALLQEVAVRLRSCARAADTVARYGGDEFVVLLEACRSPGDAEAVAAKISAALSQPYRLAQGPVELSCSIGIATHPHDGQFPDTLLQHADAAMYRAKKAGKNRFAVYAAPG